MPNSCAVFATIDDLHRAPAEEVSALTDPLGYHVRGRWLKAMAATVVTEFGGRMPDSLDELRRLPGFGPYAAAAVHTFGNGKRAPLVDTNIARVYTRAVGLPAEGSVLPGLAPARGACRGADAGPPLL